MDDLSFSMEHPGSSGTDRHQRRRKTTTIRMTLGVMDRDAGEITWFAQRNTVCVSGYMPEERGIYPKVKVIGPACVFPRTARHELPGSTLESADRWLGRLGVTEYRDMPAEKPSRAKQQKIQLIATLIRLTWS